MPYGPARSFTGGWWLLMTHQLSLEQSGTSSASLDHRAATQSLPRKRGSSALSPAGVPTRIEKGRRDGRRTNGRRNCGEPGTPDLFYKKTKT